MSQKYLPADLDRDKSGFLAHLRESGRRETTVQTYDMAIRSVYHTMDADGGMIDPRRIEPEDIVRLRRILSVCDNSKKLYLIALGRFCRFLTGRNPRDDAELLWNEDDKRRKFISPEQYRLLRSSATPEQKLMLVMGANMGLRRCETAEVRLSDIRDGRLTVRGKGHGPDGRVAMLHIPPVVCRAI